jgi:hypothetical protein
VLTCVENSLIYGELVAEGFDFCFDAVFDVCVALFAVLGEAVDHLNDPVSDLAEFGLSKAACCGGRRSKADALRHGWFFRIKGHTVFVAGDMRAPQCFFRGIALHALGAQIHQHHMGIGAVGHRVQTAFDQLV